MYYYAAVSRPAPHVVDNVAQSSMYMDFENNGVLRIWALDMSIVGKVWEHETSPWDNPTFRDSHFCETMEMTSEEKTAIIAAGEISVNTTHENDINYHDKYIFELGILDATVEGENGSAAISGELIGSLVVFHRMGVDPAKQITVKYRLVKRKNERGPFW